MDLDGSGWIWMEWSTRFSDQPSSHWLNRSFNSQIGVTHLLSSGDVLLFQINLARSGNIEAKFVAEKKSDHLGYRAQK